MDVGMMMVFAAMAGRTSATIRFGTRRSGSPVWRPIQASTCCGRKVAVAGFVKAAIWGTPDRILRSWRRGAG